MRSRTLLAVATGFGLAAVLVQPLPASAATFTSSEHTIAGLPGPSPPVPNPHNCNGVGGSCGLRATLFVPDPLPPGGKAPAVLTTHGWAADRSTSYVLEAARFLATQGYVVLSWDSRGYGQSQGYVMLDSPDYEGKDVSKLIDFLASRPEVLLDGPGDPRVGMYGQSYGGGIQFVSAAADPRIDVMIVRETWNDLTYSLFPNGIFKEEWAYVFYVGGQSFAQGNLAPDLTQWFVELNATNSLSPAIAAELKKRSAVAYAGRLKIPTLVLQGERDTIFNLVESSRNIDLISSNGAPTKLFWYWGGHGSYANYAENKNRVWTVDDPMESRQLKWLNRYLLGDASVDTGPVFEYLDEKGILRSADSVPPVETVNVTLGSAGLSLTKPPGRACPPSGIPNCSYTEASNFSSPGQPGDQAPFDPPGTFLNLDTTPLEGSLPALGNPRISFKVTTASGQPVSLFWKFFDVSPSGTKLINRLVSPIRAASGKDNVLDLAGFSYTFAKGNRLRLMVASTDAAYFGTDLADQVTFAGPVTLNLPVAAGDVIPPKPGRAANLAATGARGVAWLGIVLLAIALLVAMTSGLGHPRRRSS